ncbi:MAG: DUF72 domain-containing protein [Gemmatimonadetes bacterium]|nr:DUF72 domain-containing protein [Gemmatimonadota bacterium]
MRVRAGTSGFAYKEWKGSFYPEDLPASAMLRYYARQFATVEINNTFYRMPSEQVLRQWAQQVPAGFRFVLKASRQITHIQRLKEVAGPVAYLTRTAATLGEHLGPILFQLPPNLKQDLPRLEAFLPLIPGGCRAALEFRHASWFEDDVFDALHRANAALCLAESDEDELDVPRVATADWGYLRLRRQDYGARELRGWADWLRRQHWSEAFVFFKHEEAGTGPKLARRFLELVEADRKKTPPKTKAPPRGRARR